MNKTKEELLQLKKDFAHIENLDGAKLEMAVANFDEKKARTKLEKKIYGETWDRKSDINGVPAEKVYEIYDLRDTGSIFVVRDGDTVVQFQYHDPDEPGYVEMNGSRSKSLATKAANELIENRLDNELYLHILQAVSK